MTSSFVCECDFCCVLVWHVCVNWFPGANARVPIVSVSVCVHGCLFVIWCVRGFGNSFFDELGELTVLVGDGGFYLDFR